MLPCFLIMGEKEADMKNDIIQNIRLDMNAPKIKSSLSVRLGDTCTRSIHVTMSNGGSVVSMENALVALIEIEKPDGNHCYNDCVISGNEIQYTITTQTVNVEGTCKCQISVTFEDGAVITSPIFDLVVYSQLVDQNKVKSQNEYEHSFLTGNPHNTTYEEVGADKSGAANAALTSSKDYTDEKISEVNTELDKRALTSELTIHTSDKVVHITVEERTAWNESYQNAVAYTDQKIAALINGAPETLDTLKEIADAMEQNESVVEALNNAIGTKANLAEFNSHESNTTVHITAAERKKWNAYTTQIANLQKSIDTINKTLTSLGSSVTELQNKQGYPIAKEN